MPGKPTLLVLAGHDPSGGAGIQADIEAAAAAGVHAATVITLLTRQDTRDVHAVWPVADALFHDCLNTVAADLPINAIKTGAIASRSQVEAIAALLDRQPDLPLVVDPVLKASGGGVLADDSVGSALRDILFCRATLITPNAGEARLLCNGETDIDRCGIQLAALGCAVLITGGDEGHGEDDTAAVINRLYRTHGPDGSETRIERFEWPRLAGSFHGSGCTLASAIAARLACGTPLDRALTQGQAYTWNTLQNAAVVGGGQPVPNRIGGHVADAYPPRVEHPPR